MQVDWNTGEQEPLLDFAATLEGTGVWLDIRRTDRGPWLYIVDRRDPMREVAVKAFSEAAYRRDPHGVVQWLSVQTRLLIRSHSDAVRAMDDE